MSLNRFGAMLRQGHLYMGLWPRRPELNSIFPENKIIKATEFAISVIPALVVVSVIAQFQYGEPHYWPSVFSSVLFLVSLPLQGYYWLGKRATTVLPPSLVHWYREINSKMSDKGTTRHVVPQPCYRDLADTLKEAFQLLDISFLYE